MNFNAKDYGLNGRTAYVYGLGASGIGVAEALREVGVNVAVWDDGPMKDGRGFTMLSPSEIDWKSVGVLVKSPGIPMTTDTVKTAQAHGVPVVGDMDLLWRREQNNGVDFIGITGTNGKSTTTALVGHVLRESGIKVAVGGNIGIAALALPELPAGGVYVLELSSYQLEMMSEMRVDGGIFLNLTPDHLTRHGTMEVYLETKLKLFELAKDNARLVMGVDQAVLDETAAERGYVRVSVTHDAEYSVRGGAVLHGKDVCVELDGLEDLKGPHNAQNIACAYALLVPRWVSHDQFVAAAKTFKGLPHRLELVGTVDGIRFINDSKATNGDSSVYALQSFKDIYWICGGEPKTDGLGACINHLESVRAAFTIGKATESFAEELQWRGVPTFKCQAMDVAVREAFAAARSEGIEGAVVMLSPAAASLDQFRNFEHRGDVFVNLVQNLANGSGERRTAL